MKKQREEGAEKNFRKMRWPCMSCYLSSDPSRNENFMKPFEDFGVRRATDFVTRLLPQGAWARCQSCQDVRRGALGKELGKELGGNKNNLPEAKRRRCGKKGKEFGELGGNTNNLPKEKRANLGRTLGGSTNNEFIKERSLASTQACEKCGECGRSLTCAHFWPVDWRRRTKQNWSIKCKECCPQPPNERLNGYMARNERNSSEAAAKPITCQACKQALPRTQFPPNSSKGKFDFRKPQTCHQCRAEGKHIKLGRKRQRIE